MHCLFYKILDVKENASVEKVHAIHKDRIYNRNDKSTYDVTASSLEQIVSNNTKYLQCKVYLRDATTLKKSLLNNRVVDISLIDAPGLNSDTTKTTAVFARQEEMVVVVAEVLAVLLRTCVVLDRGIVAILRSMRARWIIAIQRSFSDWSFLGRVFVILPCAPAFPLSQKTAEAAQAVTVLYQP